MAITNREQKKKSLLNTLENPKYDWRTIPGISAEAHLTTEEAIELLADLQAAGVVIQSNLPTEDGKYLYTTREKFNRRASLGERILGAVRNRLR